MNTFQAVVLGTIQGLTEFLPVSSSGHLVLGQHLFGLTEAKLFFDVSVHAGTLLAVMIFFRREIFSILKALVGLLVNRSGGAQPQADADARLALLIVIGSVPTALIGLGFHRIADRLFSSVFIVGCCLLATGALLWATRWVRADESGPPRFSAGKALVIGTVQGLAILPGVSRSGSTIAVGLFLGLPGDVAARYSFLLSIPAILGAQMLQVFDLGEPGNEAVLNTPVLAGTVAAFVVGYASLAMLVYIVNRGRMHLFAPYCWIVGAGALALTI